MCIIHSFHSIIFIYAYNVSKIITVRVVYFIYLPDLPPGTESQSFRPIAPLQERGDGAGGRGPADWLWPALPARPANLPPFCSGIPNSFMKVIRAIPVPINVHSFTADRSLGQPMACPGSGMGRSGRAPPATCQQLGCCSFGCTLWSLPQQCACCAHPFVVCFVSRVQCTSL